jgi:hypothetical protein
MIVVTTAPDAARSPTFHVGVEWIAVAMCAAIVAWRRNLLLGIVAAVAIVGVAKALAIG